MFSLPTHSFMIPVITLEKKLRNNIKHAQLICHGHEDTQECKVAWDQVEDVQRAVRKQREKIKFIPTPIDYDDELSKREYDS